MAVSGFSKCLPHSRLRRHAIDFTPRIEAIVARIIFSRRAHTRFTPFAEGFPIGTRGDSDGARRLVCIGAAA